MYNYILCYSCLLFIADGGTERFLLGFVIRDSPSDFVNCTFWGSEHFIADLARSFCIGDVGRYNRINFINCRCT